MSEGDSRHVRIHVEDLPDLGRHFDNAHVAEVDGMALLRSFDTKVDVSACTADETFSGQEC